MNRPKDIPNGVWDTADKLVATVVNQALYQHAPDSQTAISRAILAAETRGEEREREACAAISDNNFLQEGRDEWAKGYRSASAQIAEEIRKRGKAK